MCTCMHHRFACRTDGMNNSTVKKYFYSLFNLVSVLTPTSSPIFFFFQQFDDFPRPIIAHICKGGCIISLWSERCLSFRSAAFFEFQSRERRPYCFRSDCIPCPNLGFLLKLQLSLSVPLFRTPFSPFQLFI